MSTSACCNHTDGSLLNPTQEPTTAQQRFDALYINSNEIAQRMQITRAAVLYARNRGMLPDPVKVNDNQIYVWERGPIEPYLRAWETSLKLRRGQTVTISLKDGAVK